MGLVAPGAHVPPSVALFAGLGVWASHWEVEVEAEWLPNWRLGREVAERGRLRAGVVATSLALALALALVALLAFALAFNHVVGVLAFLSFIFFTSIAFRS